MKKIKVLPPISIPEGRINRQTGAKEDQSFTMKEWLDGIVHMHEPFGKGLEGVEKGLRIKNAYSNAKKDFQLEDADFKELEAAMNSAGLNPLVAISCHIYYKAISEAVDVDISSAATRKKGK